MVEITDRGSDQQSAEHGLQTFEGDIRSVVELVLVQTLGQAATGRMDELSAALEEVRRVVTEEGRLPDSVPAAAEVEALFHTVRGPDVDRATEVLERGRGLLLSRRIEARADLGELTASHPELSSQFERLTDQLTGTASVDGVGGVPPATPSGPGSPGCARRVNSTCWSPRSVPGPGSKGFCGRSPQGS